jgi:hypothetical protein
MRTIILNDGFASENMNEIAVQVAEILNRNGENDFQADGAEIIEYTDDEYDSYLWVIDSVQYNNDGTVHSVNIDC